MQPTTASAPWPPLLGDVHRREPGVIEDLECFLGKPRILVDVSGVRGDLLLAQIAQHGAQLIVLVGQLEEVERWITEALHVGQIRCMAARRHRSRNTKSAGMVVAPR
jgi:hypothetical protein